MKITAIANQKGGVGKTTTAFNLGSCLAMEGHPVLLIDMDPQGNLTLAFGKDKESISASIYDVLVRDVPITQVIQETGVDNLHLVPANLDLAGAEITLLNHIARESVLKMAIDGYVDEYEYIFIDCPPSFSIVTINALTAADTVLIPVQSEFFAIDGVTDLLDTVRKIKKMVNPKLEVEGFVVTMYDGRTRLSQDVAEHLKQAYGKKVYQMMIPRNVRISESPSHHLPIAVYDPESKGAEAYRGLAKEFVARVEGDDGI